MLTDQALEELAPCPGRTYWDIFVKHWPDKATVCRFLERDLLREQARPDAPPVVHVVVTDSGAASRLFSGTAIVDPVAGTVSFPILCGQVI